MLVVARICRRPSPEARLAHQYHLSLCDRTLASDWLLVMYTSRFLRGLMITQPSNTTPAIHHTYACFAGSTRS